MNLSIIIPVYNEEKYIDLVIFKLMNLKFPEFVQNVEMIVVNDCSTDKTIDAIEKFKNDVTIFSLLKNQGKGAAVKFGISKAKYDTIIIQDADLELDTNDIPFLLSAMHNLKVDFVNGSRYMPGLIRPIYSYKRYLANKLFSFLTSIFIDVRITDMACGYKLFKRQLFDKIKIKSNRFGFEAELIIKALRNKKSNVTEVPVHYFPRSEGEGKKIKNIDFFRILWTILKYGLFRFN